MPSTAMVQSERLLHLSVALYVALSYLDATWIFPMRKNPSFHNSSSLERIKNDDSRGN